MRPANINQIFDEILDIYRTCYLGLASLYDPNIQNYYQNNIPDDIATMGIITSFNNDIDNKPLNANFRIKSVIDLVKSKGEKEAQTLAQKNMSTLCRIFIIYSYDILKEQSLLGKFWKEPIIQFFRHIRNGCAHNNKFKIDNQNELLKLPAEWRGKKIEISLNDSNNNVVNNFFKEGDLILLLEDISNLILI